MQNILVALIGIGVLAYVGWKLYKTFTRKANGNGSCGNCCSCSERKNDTCTNS